MCVCVCVCDLESEYGPHGRAIEVLQGDLLGEPGLKEVGGLARFAQDDVVEPLAGRPVFFPPAPDVMVGWLVGCLGFSELHNIYVIIITK